MKSSKDARKQGAGIRPPPVFGYPSKFRKVFIMDEESLGLVRLLLARLERISADSFWAHRASGVRGSLARMLDNIEKGEQVSASELKRMMELGFKILERAAREKVR